MIQNNDNYYRKMKSTNSTPKSININQYNKTINYKISNTNINNNITNLIYPFTPIDKFNKKFAKETEGTSQNSSDIKLDYSPNSLKDQILSPEDEDLYLNYKNKNYSVNNNHMYDDNYLLNYNFNPKSLKISTNNNSKKILILDLDETLVHSSFYPFNCEDENNIKPDIFFTILFNNKYYDVYVILRPYFNEFLLKMSKLFDIYIFTASIKEYAEPLLIKLDKKNLIKKKLYREHCTLSEDNKFIKDLNNLNENLKNVILIDNNPNSFRYNKCNGIPIKTWHFEQNDRELIKIIPFLTFLANVDDVREYIPQIIENDEIDYNKIDNILNKFNLNESAKKNTIKKCEKKLINIIKKTSNNIKNKNKNNSHSKIRISYPQLFTNNKSIKINNNEKILVEKDEENNNIFANSINFNKYEERKNNNNTLSDNNYFHSPATINFREPSSIGEYNNNRIKSNNTILNKTNVNINRIKKIEKKKYIRSKSSYNFNDLSENINNYKLSTINFNLINNQVNNKNRSNSNNKNTKIKNFKSFNKEKNLSNNYYRHNQNEEKSSIYFNNNDYYLFTLNQNENGKNSNINTFLNNNNAINNKSLEQKISLSTRMIKFKNSNKAKKENEIKVANNLIKQQKENLFRHKNISNKNIVENEKNKESEYNFKFNHVNISNLDNNKIHTFKSTKQKVKKAINGRNNENIMNNNRNMNKYLLVSKTSEYSDNTESDNINYINKIPIDLKQHNNYINKISKNNIDINNYDNTVTKKIICTTLNSHYMNNHPKKMKDKIEENKNNTMEITKNAKSIYFDIDNLALNLKGVTRKNKSLNNKKSNINYNIIKQKNQKNKKNINREINLLNKFIKEFNNNSQKRKNTKESHEKNENILKKFNTQRESRYINRKNNFNYNYDSLYIEKQRNKKELINKEKKDKFDEEKLCSNYFSKNRNYSINKDNNNYIEKRGKHNNYGNNHINFNDDEKEVEIENYNNVKNIKYTSISKLSDKKKIQNNYENKDKRSTLINDKTNYLMRLYYSYGNNKI